MPVGLYIHISRAITENSIIRTKRQKLTLLQSNDKLPDLWKNASHNYKVLEYMLTKTVNYLSLLRRSFKKPYCQCFKGQNSNKTQCRICPVGIVMGLGLVNSAVIVVL